MFSSIKSGNAKTATVKTESTKSKSKAASTANKKAASTAKEAEVTKPVERIIVRAAIFNGSREGWSGELVAWIGVEPSDSNNWLTKVESNAMAEATGRKTFNFSRFVPGISKTGERRSWFALGPIEGGTSMNEKDVLAALKALKADTLATIASAKAPKAKGKEAGPAKGKKPVTVATSKTKVYEV